MRMRKAVLAGLVASALLFVGGRAQATIYTLTDLNSVVQISDGGSDPQPGMFNWKVDGIDHIFQQWFWYRVGATAESPIHTLTLSGASAGTRTLTLTYTGAGFVIDVDYVLLGGSAGSGVSDVTEGIRIRNTGTSDLDFHFFQYTDFDIHGVLGDTGVFTNAQAVQQTDSGGGLSETVVTPAPSHREIAIFPGIFAKLADGDADDLSDLPGIGVPVGPGDVTWAFQWDQVIAAGGTLIISKDKRLDVPEPMTLLLLSAGIIGVACYSRRRA